MKWKLVNKKISDLKPYEKNPRKLTEKGMKDLGKSLDKFGLAEPIVCNTDLTIIGGHARYYSLKKKGIKEADVYLPDRKLTDEEVKELNIRLNKNIAGEFDFDILANEFELPDLLEWGFEEKELDLSLWNKVDEEKLDDVPEVQKEAVSKTGDIFELNGKHRIMCGDSTNKANVSDLCANKLANMIFIDPPYAVNYGADQDVLNKKSGGKFRTTARPIIGDNLNAEQCAEKIWKPSFENLYLFAEDDCSFYMTMCQGGDQMMMMMMMMMSVHWQIKHELIWAKSSPVFSMGRLDYDYKHEPILFGWKKKHNFYGNGQFKNSLWEIPKPNKSELHPTMKPIALIENALLNSSKASDICLDLFLGSGTTLIACEQTNRICYGMEIDPIYIDVILRRYHNLYPDKEIKCITRKYNFDKLLNEAKAA